MVKTYDLATLEEIGRGNFLRLCGCNTLLMSLSLKIAKQLSEKPNKAMKLTKKRIWEMFKKDMNNVFEKAKMYHRQSFDSGEPQKKSKYFLKK